MGPELDMRPHFTNMKYVKLVRPQFIWRKITEQQLQYN